MLRKHSQRYDSLNVQLNGFRDFVYKQEQIKRVNYYRYKTKIIYWIEDKKLYWYKIFISFKLFLPSLIFIDISEIAIS